jgi:hypothetical protein
MYPESLRRHAIGLLASGVSMNSVSKELGISRAAIRDWRDNGVAAKSSSLCPRCRGRRPGDEASYAYLLGMYLGDGCLSPGRRDVYCLRISCDTKYPDIIEAAAAAIRSVKTDCRVFLVSAPGCTVVGSYWKHWICLFPQHGARSQARAPDCAGGLAAEIVQRHPGPLLRGLFHSDSCRITNWTTRMVAGERKRYEYPRRLWCVEWSLVVC